MAELAQLCTEKAEEIRAIETARLDVMLHAIAAKVRSGDLPAIDRVLKIMDRRAALWGLDAPKHQVLTGADGGPVRLATVADEVKRIFSAEEPLTINGNSEATPLLTGG